VTAIDRFEVGNRTKLGPVRQGSVLVIFDDLCQIVIVIFQEARVVGCAMLEPSLIAHVKQRGDIR